MLRIRTRFGLAAAFALAACSDGAVVVPPSAPEVSTVATTPPNGAAQTPADTSRGTPRPDSSTGPAVPPPSTNPRDSVALFVSPGNSVLAPGGTFTFRVQQYANGTLSTPATVAFTSSNPAVATVSAAGVVTAVAVGTTQIRVGAGDRWVQLSVTVTADGRPNAPAPSDTAGSRPPQPPPAYVAEFTLAGRVFDASPGPDSAAFRPIVGATLKLVAVRDSMTGQPAAPESVAGTATTDANGRFALPRAPGGLYRLDVTPPEGSGFGFVSILVSRPVQSELRYEIPLRRKP